jgi:Ca2+-binding EF-hand superfamily protein
MASEEESEKVIKVATLAGLVFALAASILAICSVVLPWWTGNATGKLIVVGVDETATTMAGTITLWAYELKLRLPPAQGKVLGTEYMLISSWNDMCTTAENTMTVIPSECLKVKLIRAFTCLTFISAMISAVFIVVARRYSSLWLLVGGGTGLLAALCGVAAILTGVATGTGGLTGTGFLLILAATGCAALDVASVFYAASKAMPLPSSDSGDADGSRMARLQDAFRKAAHERKYLNQNIEQRRSESKDSDEIEDKPDEPSYLKRKPLVAFQELLNSTEDSNSTASLELLEAAFFELDADGMGSVSMNELVDALRSCGLPVSEASAGQVMSEFDKDNDGNISIHEFVEFFRTVDEINKFSKKVDQRAAFLAFVCNFCFLVDLILVGIILMLFIRMDPGSSGDNYTIIKYLLILFATLLGVLFLSVIAIPALRMTLGPNVNAWQHHYNQALARSVEKKNRAKALAEANKVGVTKPFARGGIRAAAWAEGGGEAPPQVNAALYGSSYRVTKHQFALGDSYEQDFYPQPLSGPRTPVAASGARTPLQSQPMSVRSGSSSKQTPVGYSSSNGVIMSRNGDLVRYDPASFRQAAMTSMTRNPMSFTPMQVHNLATSSDEPVDHANSMLAITSGSGFR